MVEIRVIIRHWYCHTFRNEETVDHQSPVAPVVVILLMKNKYAASDHEAVTITCFSE